MDLINRIYKSFIYRSNRLFRQSKQNVKKVLHRRHLPKLGSLEAQIVKALKKDGAYISSIDELAEFGLPEVRENYEKLKSTLTPTESEELELSDGYISIVSKNTIMKNSEILKWGLNEQLLAIVENYIGLPPLFPGIYLRRDVANSKQTGTRYWHIDGEDSKIIKVIIYLEDVETNDGPFCYIPRSSITTEKFEVFNGSRVNNEDVTKKIPERFQNECTGPAGTVIFVDTCSVWHRGKTGTNKDRYTAFYIYSSRIPLRPEAVEPMFSLSNFLVQHPDLSSLQKNALFLSSHQKK